jgi:hypothetical protein
VDIFSLGLKLSTAGGAEALKMLGEVEARGTAAQQKIAATVQSAAKVTSAEINESISALAKFARQIDVTNADAVRAFRESAAAEKEWLAASRANTEQHMKLDAAIRGVESRVARTGGAVSGLAAGADNMGRRFGQATLQMAGGLEIMARTGTVMGEGLRSVVSQGSNIAFMFGTAGPIVGAIGIAGMAIVDLFANARKQIEETERQAKETLDRMQDAGDFASMNARARDVMFGTPSKDFKDGIDYLQSHVPQLEASLNAAQRRLGTGFLDLVKGAITGGAAGVAGSDFTIVQALKQQFAAEKAQLDALKKERDDILRRMLAPDTRPRLDARGLPITTTAQRVGDMPILDTPGIVGTGFDSALDVRNLLPKRFHDELVVPVRLHFEGEDDAATQAFQGLEERFKNYGETLSTTFADALAAGVEGGFGDFGKTLLSGLGSFFIETGKAILKFSALMMKLFAAIKASPLLAGPVGIVIGAGLIALGASLRGAASDAAGSSLGGHSGGYSQSSAAAGNDVTRYTLPAAGPSQYGGSISPVSPTQVTNIYYGIDDPKGQRAIVRMYDNGKRRGI